MKSANEGPKTSLRPTAIRARPGQVTPQSTQNNKSKQSTPPKIENAENKPKQPPPKNDQAAPKFIKNDTDYPASDDPPVSPEE